MAELLADRVDRLGVPARLVTNPSNRGFVASVNRAAEGWDGDLVLLNADTRVPVGWLRRLAAAARPDSGGPTDVGTVTPLTNDGSICSVSPLLVEARSRWTVLALGGATWSTTSTGGLPAPGPRSSPESASACTSPRRPGRPPVRSTKRAFERGYGEEVDFCLRAGDAGFRHLVEDRTFVWHRGGVSFGADEEEARDRSRQVLHRRHPGFAARNRRERRRDPLAATQRALELAHRRRDTARPLVLHLLHTPSEPAGGTEKHVAALVEALADEVDFLEMWPTDSRLPAPVDVDRRGASASNGQLPPSRTERPSGCRPGRSGARPRRCARGLDLAPRPVRPRRRARPQPHRAVARRRSTRSRPATRPPSGGVGARPPPGLSEPLLALRGSDGVRRARPTWTSAPTCLPATTGHEIGALVELRQAPWHQRLDRVDAWVAPSRERGRSAPARVPDRLTTGVRIIEHGSLVASSPTPRPVRRDGASAPLRLAFVGRGWPKKGLAQANRPGRSRRLSEVAEVHHLGPLVGRGRPSPAVSRSVSTGGARRVAWTIWTSTSCSCPGPYAETYGLVMSEALAAGRPVIGAGYGALGERIRRDGVGWVVRPRRRRRAGRTGRPRWPPCAEEVDRVAERVAGRWRSRRSPSHGSSVSGPLPAGRQVRHTGVGGEASGIRGRGQPRRKRRREHRRGRGRGRGATAPPRLGTGVAQRRAPGPDRRARPRPSAGSGDGAAPSVGCGARPERWTGR